MIPEAAVEAAARAIDASKAEGCGCCAYPEFTTEDDKRADELDINVRALLIAKEALEAAAPHMRQAFFLEMNRRAVQDELRAAPIYPLGKIEDKR